MKGPPTAAPCRGVRGHHPQENCGIFSSGKGDFRHSEAKSACLNVSFFLS